MGYKVAIAKDFELEIQDNSATPTYLKIPQLTKLTLSKGANDVDLSNFDDDGFKSSMVISRTRSLSFACNYQYDETTKELHPALKLLADLDDKVGYDSVGNFRITFPNGDKFTFVGSVKLSDQGGGVDDKVEFGGEITINGKLVPDES